MTYTITGLDPTEFTSLIELPDAAREERGVITKIADAVPGYPCRVTLEDATPGERVILFNYESHKVDTPYRSSYAIYVRERADRAARYVDELPRSSGIVRSRCVYSMRPAI